MQAKEYFEKAAANEEAGGYYNLGVLYLKGIGVEKDVKIACQFFIKAANVGQPKAFFQLAKMFHTGVGLKKNLGMVWLFFVLALFASLISLRVGPLPLTPQVYFGFRTCPYPFSMKNCIYS